MRKIELQRNRDPQVDHSIPGIRKELSHNAILKFFRILVLKF